MTKDIFKIALLAVFATFCFSMMIDEAFAVPIVNPENGHYYEYIANSTITWSDAKTAAETSTYQVINGNLVTITTASENIFVDNLVPDASHSWIGLEHDRIGFFKWITGETYSYTNWDTGKPTATGDGTDFVEFFETTGKWTDTVNNDTDIDGYVVEYNIPVLNIDNGNYYLYVESQDIRWTAAKTAVESSTYNGITGNLVSITTATENRFVKNLLPDDARAWIGLSDDLVEGTYQWENGDIFDYTNWDTGHPLSTKFNEDYGLISENTGKWAITTNVFPINGYVIEYDAFGCNSSSSHTLNPANGHWYDVIDAADITWWDAKEAAERYTCDGTEWHLATITDLTEQQYIESLTSNGQHLWLGMSDVIAEGFFQWITGEPIVYSNWVNFQPDDHNDNEDFVEIRGSGEKWNDVKSDAGEITGYIIELSD